MPKINSRRKAKLWNPKLFALDMARITILPLFWMAYRIKVLTPSGEKDRGWLKGGAIIAANHNTFSDPVIMAATFWYRRSYYMIGEVVMKGKLRSALLTGAGGIKVERGIADIEAVKKSVKVLKEGHLLILFPQGGIVQGEAVEKVKSGAALMALQAGVPILPVHICPRKHWYNRQVVLIGEAIYPDEICTKKMPSTADIEKISDVLVDAMNACATYTEDAK